MNLGFNLLWSEDFLNYSIFIHEVCSAQDSNSFSAASHLLAPTSKLLQ